MIIRKFEDDVSTCWIKMDSNYSEDQGVIIPQNVDAARELVEYVETDRDSHIQVVPCPNGHIIKVNLGDIESDDKENELLLLASSQKFSLESVKAVIEAQNFLESVKEEISVH